MQVFPLQHMISNRIKFFVSNQDQDFHAISTTGLWVVFPTHGGRVVEGNTIGKHSVTPVKKFLAFKQCSSAEQYEGLAHFYAPVSLNNEDLAKPFLKIVVHVATLQEKCVSLFSSQW